MFSALASTKLNNTCLRFMVRFFMTQFMECELLLTVDLLSSSQRAPFDLSFFALKPCVLACSFAYCKPCLFTNLIFTL